jgi:NitT/TauT family transport system substrate-binding protein
MSDRLTSITLLSPIPHFTAGFAPLVLMKALGFDHEEGIDVTVRELGIPSKAWQGVANREGDATWVNTVFIFTARDMGLDMKVFSAYARHQNRSFVVADESPVRSIAELKGATLGLFARDHEQFADAALRAHGIDPERDVRFVSFRHEQSFEADRMAAALKSGEIKALWLLDIMHGHVEIEGVKLRRLPAGVVDRLTPSSCLFTNGESLANRPEALEGLARAIARGTLFAHVNPEAAIRVVWKHEPRTRPAPGQEERALRRDRIGLMARLTNHGIEDPADPRLGWISAAEMESWRDFMVETKAISKPLPLETYYTTAFMGEINDFDAPALIARARSFVVN